MKTFNTFNGLDTSAIDLSDKAKLSLYKKSSNSGISVDILEEVYARGYRTWNESFGGTPDSFAFDRVNSFISGGFAVQLDEDLLTEDLRKWFKEKWVRFDTKGNIKGQCARDPGEGKPKCRPLASARAMSKEDRAKAARRKRREDPVADRPGKGEKPVFVKTNEEILTEKNVPTNPSLWARAKSMARSKFDVYPSAYANGWAAKWYKSKGGGWKSTTNEELNVPTPSLEQIAKKHKKPISELEKALKKGVKIEREHTKNSREAAEIARDHLSERPDYYKKLERVEKGPVQELNYEKPSKDPNKSSNRFIGTDELTDNYRKRTPGQTIKEVVREYIEEAKSPAWQRKEGKRETGGLNQKGVESYRRENPGSKLKTAVTTEPSKLKKGSKSWKRRKSFCSRMKGMKAKLTSAKTARDPDSRINKSLRAWNC
jgi:hypothetical protein